MSFSFWLKESFSGFLKEKGSALVSFSGISFFFLIFGLFLLVTYNLYSFTQNVKERIEIDVYLKEGLTQKEVEELRLKITRLEGVETVIFRSKEKALQELKNYLGEGVLEGLESNPLPSAWVVRLNPTYQSLEKMEKLSSQMGNFSGVEEIDYGRFWVGKMERLFRIFLWVSLALGIFMILGSLFLMIHTLRTIRSSRSEDFKLLKLLGAENHFWRKVFLMEGFVQGGGGSFFSLLILFVLYNSFNSLGFKLDFLPSSLWIGFLLSGILLGGFAGLLSGGKFDS